MRGTIVKVVQPVGPRFYSGRTGRGFTLIELVTVIIITGILAATVGLFIGAPVQGFVDQARRAALTDAADLALLRIARDLRTALPNSVRVTGGGTVIELLPTIDGERYRSEAPGEADDRLDIGVPDAAFDTFGRLGPPGAFTPTERLAVYPVGGGLGDPYRGPALTAAGILSSQTGVVVDGQSEFRITLNAAHTFPLASPSRRVYLVDGPVSYVCAGGRLLRYAGYPLQDDQPSGAALAGLATPVVVVDLVLGCQFRYDAGTATAARNAVVQIGVTMAAGDVPDEQVRMLRQVHVDNTP